MLLFALMIALHVALPLLRELAYVNTAIGVGFVLVLAAAGWLSIERRRRRGVYLGALGLGLIMLFVLLARPGLEGLRFAWNLYNTGFFFFTTGLVTSWALRQRRVNTDTVLASVSGYYLLGIAWAILYAVIDNTVVGAFNQPLAPEFRLETAFYFSFVTLTTLGYGDFAPTHPLTHALVTAEALLGQVYVTVLIARLVALHITHNPSRREPE